MRVHAQVVSQPMREERHTCPFLKDFLFFTFQDPNVQQPLNRNPMRLRMHIVPHHPLRQHLRTLPLHLQHNIINLPTLAAKRPLDRKCPRDIRRIAPKLATRI